MHCPYSSARLAEPLPLRFLLRKILREALSVSLFWLQLIGSLTITLPFVLCTLKAVVSRLLDTVAPVILPPDAATVKLLESGTKLNGSISQRPPLPPIPAAARVETTVPSATCTLAALVSTNPPSPPLGAEASSRPAILAWPNCMSPISLMTPFWLSSVLASMMPVLLTVAALRAFAALADIKTWPPLAWISCLLSASALRAPSSILKPNKLPLLRFKVTRLPAASSAVPSVALMTPSLRTSGASMAM